MGIEREQQIRDRAYRIWQEEGEPHGRADDHWSRAEQEHGTDAPAGSTDELIQGAADDLPFGEPADTGAQEAAPEPPQTTAAEPTGGGASDARIASASGAVEPPKSAAPAGKKTGRTKARTKTTN